MGVNSEALRIIRKAAQTQDESLDLSGLKLGQPWSQLPSELSLLTHVKFLNLSHNLFSIFPEEILSLRNLEYLDLNNNKLRYLPPELETMDQLRVLSLYHNQLEEIPSGIGKLIRLQELKLHNNKISTIPDEIGMLMELRALYINHNRLTTIPSQIGDLRTLSKILIHGNPLPDTALTIAELGITELLSYLRSLSDLTESLYEAKLVLVGEGGVGKTSLVAALSDKPFLESRETTHGIEICRLSVRHPQLSDKVIDLNVWDFGGQPVYRVTHQFFYSKRSLYLLLWSPRRGVELCDVEGWIKRIRLRIGDTARIIIVSTHSETGGRVARIDKEVLVRDYGEVIAGFHEIDSKTGAGIDSLKLLLSDVSSMLPQMGSPFSLRWKDARDEVLKLDDTRITFEQFANICARHDLDETATRTLADLMHDLGHIIYYGDDEGLSNEIILHPEWLSKAIGFVLEDRITNEEKGVLAHSRLREIWFDHGFPDRERYPLSLHPYFLRLMEKYDASYRLEEGRSSLVAQLVPSYRPELPWTTENLRAANDDNTHVKLIVQMEEDPPGLIPWMIVRTHHFSTEPRLHWQRGMFLKYDTHGEALLELRGRELHITVKASWPNYFIEVLRYILNRLIEERWPGLEATFSVPCPVVHKTGISCKGRFPLNTLHKLKPKFESVPCIICSRETPIDHLLVGFTPPDTKQQLQRIERKIDLTRAQLFRNNSENAARFRIILRAMNSESSECPHLFTLLPENLALRFDKIGTLRYRLTLWCEMPGYQHPVCPIGSEGNGEYVFECASEWLKKIAPYATLVAKTLRTVIPLVGPIAKIAIDESLLKGVSGHLDLMEKTTKALLEGELSARSGSEFGNLAVSEVEGASLREFYALLLELDKSRHWGGLRRTLLPTGEYLWLCHLHYAAFDPGLPNLSQ
jgi:internalin A